MSTKVIKWFYYKEISRNCMHIIKSTVYGLGMAVFAVAMVVSTPVVHAQWDSTDTSGSYDGGGCCSYDTTGTYTDTYTPASTYTDTYTPASTYYDTYTPVTPTYYDTYTPASSGATQLAYGGTSSYATPSYYGSSPSYYAASTPIVTTPSHNTTSTYAPTTNTTNNTVSTYSPYTSSTYSPYTSSTYSPYTSSTYAPTTNTTSTYAPYTYSSSTYAPTSNTTSTYSPYTYSNNGNTTDSNNSCTTPGSCSTTVTTTTMNSGNTTINSPINITSSNPPASQTQIIYNNPAPQPITYTYTSPTPYQNPPSCVITLSQAAYGGQATLSWSSSNAASGWINNIGTVAPTGSMLVTPSAGMVYTANFTGQNGQSATCSTAVAIAQPIYHAIQAAVPYVTLSEAPYTGLELGPFGTVIYWSFLVLACLYMTYLLVVKRVQIQLVRYLKRVLFDEETTDAPVAHVAVVQAPVETAAPAKTTDAIDDFIMSQIKRA